MYKKYYFEIKNRILLLSFTWLTLLIICSFYKESLFFIFLNLNKNVTPYFIVTNVTEIFYIYLSLSIFIANQITLLMFLYQIFLFLTLGFHISEYFKIKSALFLCIIAWVFSIFFLLKFVLPFSWFFFINFQKTANKILPVSLFFESKIKEYLNYHMNLYYSCNIYCQIFATIIFFLHSINGNLKVFKKLRKFFYFISIIFSTLITPPEILYQLLLSLGFISLYEIIIFYSYLKNLIRQPIKT